MTYVSRKEWGAAPRQRGTAPQLNVGQARGMAVHYEAVDRAGTSHDKCDDIVRGIQKFHQQTRGWADIAYSFLVCRHGYVYEGRGWGVRTAANGTDDANASFHAVCYLDDDQEDTRDVTPEALSALARVIRECREKGWGAEVKPHRTFKNTSCPGNELTGWIARRGFEDPSLDCHPDHPAKTPEKGTQAPAKGIAGVPSWYKRPLRVQNPLIKGNDVVNVQRRLKAKEDGLYGPGTEAKVKGFQKLHGLTVDGVFGPKTAAKLVEVYG